MVRELDVWLFADRVGDRAVVERIVALIDERCAMVIRRLAYASSPDDAAVDPAG